MNEDRFRNLKKEYDLIIVGGGIYGAALLWEATLRGLSTILIEKDDFCSATSANSLKIIHGGLRYLQNLNLKRVRQSANELKILMNMAPHLIRPLPCVIPTQGKLKRSKMAFRMALKIYDLLCFKGIPEAGLENVLPPGHVFSIDQFRKFIPGSEFSNITGGVFWYDALNFNTERMVIDFITSSTRRGADAFNYIEGLSLITHNDRAIGITANDHLSGQNLEIFGKMIVNATGPWIDKLIGQNDDSWSKNRVRFVKAVNLVVKRSMSNFAFGLESAEPVDDLYPAKRFIFFVPWRESTMIGTWYFTNESSSGSLAIGINELSSCIDQLRKVFPAANITKDDIRFIHLGLVPVAPMMNIKKFKLKEHHSLIEHKLFHGPDNFISVLGVKYTTARYVASDTIKFVSGRIGKGIDLSAPAEPLDGGDIKNIEEFIQTKETSNEYRLSKKTIRHLVLNYGTKYDEIVGLISENNGLNKSIPGSDEAIQAELFYCIKNENTYFLSDLLLRRTDLGSMGRPNDRTINFCAAFMAKEMGWSKETKEKQINSFIKYYDRVSSN